ncbi:hypothetical protein GCM10009727_28980 [Actinomadura napierensis]|uniref:Uncharacterized protein n=1 Tax=Actinomadura napierensis TaxID=267854 RepID=A0ABP5KRC2_9ACTN
MLAHYLHAAYRYGSEELLRVSRIAIRPSTFQQLRGIQDRFVDRNRPERPGRAVRPGGAVYPAVRRRE